MIALSEVVLEELVMAQGVDIMGYLPVSGVNVDVKAEMLHMSAAKPFPSKHTLQVAE